MSNRPPVETQAPPAGEHIHMPSPSAIPVINAAALAIAIVGITFHIALVIIGLVVFIGTTIRWIQDTRHELEHLPLEHHH